MDRIRTFLVVTACLATACTTILGLDDVPNVPATTSTSTPDSGTSDATTADSGTDLTSAITALSTAYCTQSQKCLPVTFDYYYASIDECITSYVTGYAWSTRLPDTGETGPAMAACASAVSAETCDEYTSSVTPTACQIVGTKALGAKCYDDTQCASGLCNSPYTQCGTCVAAPQSGESCFENECAPGLACAPNGKCATPRLLNAACDDADPCDSRYACSPSTSTCVVPPATLGATCEMGVGCNNAQGFFCNFETLKCIPYSVVVPGVACTTTTTATTTAYVACRRASGCSTGTCGPYPAEGQACNPDTGPDCLAPLYCVNNVCTALPTSTASCN